MFKYIKLVICLLKEVQIKQICWNITKTINCKELALLNITNFLCDKLLTVPLNSYLFRT